MSVTVYVDGWTEHKYLEAKVFADAEHPDLPDFYFSSDPDYSRDSDGRWFRMDRDYNGAQPFAENGCRESIAVICHSVIGNGNAHGIPSEGCLKPNQIGCAIQALQEHPFNKLKFHDVMLGLLRIARAKNVGIYWV